MCTCVYTYASSKEAEIGRKRVASGGCRGYIMLMMSECMHYACVYIQVYACMYVAK